MRGFMQTKNSQAQFKTIEDMQRMIENFPEFKQSERCTTKHFNIFQELKKFVEGCNLYKVSECEQDLVSTQGDSGKQTNFKRISDILNSANTSKKEKLRLLLLFSVRYEGDSLVFKLKELCRTQGISEPQLQLVNQLAAYAGKSQRRSDLFQDKDMLSKSKKIFSSMFTEIQNVYMQHKPYVSGIVDSAFKSKLSAVDFPSPSKDTNLLAKPSNVIAFVIGGATFEEAADLSTTYNADRDCVVLGGSSVHNSKSFIADLMSMQTLNPQSQVQSFEIEQPHRN